MTITKLSNEKWEELLKRVKEGEKVVDLAKEYGVNRASVYHRLGSNTEASSDALKISKLERENKALKELIGKITYELSKEKKEI